jgi:uncharacterized protein (TIGR02145 family)
MRRKTSSAFLGCLLLLLSCAQEPAVEIPFVNTDEVGIVTDATAVCGGSIINMGGAEVTDRGLCWGKLLDPTLSDSVLSAAESTHFTCTMRNLIPGTVYYVRAYASNKGGTAYGLSKTFTTNSLNLLTMSVTEIKASSAICGTYAGNGGDSVTVSARGLCWGIVPQPTIHDSATSIPFEEGIFKFSIPRLKHATTYYVRSFLKNASGYIYGNEVSFTTKNGEPVLMTGPPMKIGAYSILTSMQASDFGGLDVSECGVCWGKNLNPSIAEYKMVLGTTTDFYTCDLNNLEAATSYHVRGYILSDEGVFYGPDVPFSTLPASGKFKDIDNNEYRYATFFGKTWMLENLKTTKYRNGEPIELVTNESFDISSTVGKYVNYNNWESSSAVYGRLYDWYAIHDLRNIAPVGWHIPTDAEWRALADSLGGTAVAGRKLMDYDSGLWPKEIGISAESGFHALPGGILGVTNLFLLQGVASYWWSSNYSSWMPVWYVHWYYKDLKNVDRSGFNALSVRCIRDY